MNLAELWTSVVQFSPESIQEYEWSAEMLWMFQTGKAYHCMEKRRHSSIAGLKYKIAWSLVACWAKRSVEITLGEDHSARAVIKKRYFNDQVHQLINKIIYSLNYENIHDRIKSNSHSGTKKGTNNDRITSITLIQYSVSTPSGRKRGFGRSVSFGRGASRQRPSAHPTKVKTGVKLERSWSTKLLKLPILIVRRDVLSVTRGPALLVLTAERSLHFWRSKTVQSTYRIGIRQLSPRNKPIEYSTTSRMDSDSDIEIVPTKSTKPSASQAPPKDPETQTIPKVLKRPAGNSIDASAPADTDRDHRRSNPQEPSHSPATRGRPNPTNLSPIGSPQAEDDHGSRMSCPTSPPLKKGTPSQAVIELGSSPLSACDPSSSYAQPRIPIQKNTTQRSSSPLSDLSSKSPKNDNTGESGPSARSDKSASARLSKEPSASPIPVRKKSQINPPTDSDSSDALSDLGSIFGVSKPGLKPQKPQRNDSQEGNLQRPNKEILLPALASLLRRHATTSTISNPVGGNNKTLPRSHTAPHKADELRNAVDKGKGKAKQSVETPLSSIDAGEENQLSAPELDDFNFNRDPRHTIVHPVDHPLVIQVLLPPLSTKQQPIESRNKLRRHRRDSSGRPKRFIPYSTNLQLSLPSENLTSLPHPHTPSVLLCKGCQGKREARQPPPTRGKQVNIESEGNSI
ncbi:hypothetical protein KEM48_006985 [Puccinia striiformis f. sp. tritici PST-130]|nr:hypothetical protein KEM48_006985 [Puccinia striiformis f. sp. tritici PST-130]